MKFLVVAVLLISALAMATAQEATDACYFPTCVAPGATCLSNTTNSDTYFCQTGYYCNGDYDTSLDFPTCVKYVDVGGLCDTKTYRCRPDLTCYTQGAVPTCQKLSYAALGEDCDTSLQCANSNTECNPETNKCTLKFVNNAQLACSSSFDCAYGTFCNVTGTTQKNLCLAWKANGDECTDDYQCDYASVCSPKVGSTPVVNVCNPQFSKGQDQICTESVQNLDFGLTNGVPAFDCDIGQGLQCNGTACVPRVASSCNATQQCSNVFESCACGSVNNIAGSRCVSQVNFNTECKTNINNYLTCLKENQCGAVNGDVTKSSCAVEKCSKYICNNPCVQSAFSCGDAQTNFLCIATNGASFFAPSMAIVLIFAIVAMLF
ncbi:hypothetical protein CYY_009115 [Polysphondylium violaceum]|uniref:Paramecium surface antigen repeat-containing protein n=1 Tax=Polysphondylium violaceum TaxID=133409 RepID=A0A8J4PPF9_9MYCE|nr:hypothetical protein CYY_009115 [Polysphondylium violaceum]